MGDWANEQSGPQSDRKLFFKMEPGSKALQFSLSHRKLQSGPQSDRKLFFKMEPGSKALQFSLSHRNLQDDGEGEEERKLYSFHKYVHHRNLQDSLPLQ